ncbi:toll/interleukin-1 receptor domain-containing protein [Actinophytocola sp.]|uniref:toll/interleukin-1 receptor domain-containing protein n=1 Tax=Actinophytocola sp. TaxID=1872138 RepID=UPI003D6A7D4C
MPGYEFDVFISYSRFGSAPKWLMNHFYPKFQDCLADQTAPMPKVFLDKTMSRGTHWPSQLEKALCRSKIMIAVLTPPYFESRWCMAEWHSMRAREKLLGLTNLDRPQGLIYPILYSDSDNFPIAGRELGWWDFKDLATPEPVFQESRDWVHFHRRVTDLARDLVQLLPQVPEWRSDWPVVERPDPVLLPPPPIPRFDL